MLVSNDKLEIIHEDEACKTPQIHPWHSNNTLLAWPNPVYFVDSSVQVDDDGSQLSFDEKIKRKFATIQAKIEKHGGRVVDPIKARYMIAVIDSDPFPTSQNMEFRTVELAYETERVPTPILPKTRQIQFTVCWLISSFNGDLHTLELKFNKISERMCKVEGESFEFELGHHNPDQYPEDHYITCHFYYVAPVGYEKTSAILSKIEPELFSLVDNLELIIKDFFKIQRATEEFWRKVLWVRFNQ